MLCYVYMLCYVMLCLQDMLCYVMLCYIVLCYCYVMLCTNQTIRATLLHSTNVIEIIRDQIFLTHLTNETCKLPEITFGGNTKGNKGKGR